MANLQCRNVFDRHSSNSAAPDSLGLRHRRQPIKMPGHNRLDGSVFLKESVRRLNIDGDAHGELELVRDNRVLKSTWEISEAIRTPRNPLPFPQFTPRPLRRVMYQAGHCRLEVLAR